jgi:hypothetical protein
MKTPTEKQEGNLGQKEADLEKRNETKLERNEAEVT